jgi:hypothetical protein
VIARLGMNDADVGHDRLREHTGNITGLHASSRASASLNSTTLVVTGGSTGGPMFPAEPQPLRRGG